MRRPAAAVRAATVPAAPAGPAAGAAAGGNGVAPSPPASLAAAKAKPEKRKHRYTEEERDKSDVITSKLMEMADFNSNKAGGAAEYKRRLVALKKLSPAELVPKLEAIGFKGNTCGLHGKGFDLLIEERRARNRVVAGAGA